MLTTIPMLRQRPHPSATRQSFDRKQTTYKSANVVSRHGNFGVQRELRPPLFLLRTSCLSLVHPVNTEAREKWVLAAVPYPCTNFLAIKLFTVCSPGRARGRLRTVARSFLSHVWGPSLT